MKLGKRANVGVNLFLGIILFNLTMFVFVYAANADDSVSDVGSADDLNYNINGTTTEELDTVNVAHRYDGFNISVFGLPWWVNIFYVTFQGIMISVSVYALVRGLS
jgi:hypothetical protein